jgi:hypothetical protein
MSDNLHPVSTTKEFDFEDLRPYYDHEVKPILHKLINDPLFMKLVNHLFPDMTFEQVQEKAARVNSNLDFQMEFMHAAIRKIVSTTASGLTHSGFVKLEKDKAYLYVANHRDILLDAAILQVLLVEHGFETTEITFGSNLKAQGFITEFGRVNRMFTVEREGTSKELYEISRKLSAYIRHTINERNVSVWIAQRNGRAKNGHDATQTGLLKMLNISGSKNFSESFKGLNIVPLSISYEYEPCDGLKTQELYLSGISKYVKAPGEDLNSIAEGIRQYKGNIHLAAGEPISLAELESCQKLENENDKFKELAAVIDRRIYKEYKLYPVNYIACDLLQDKNDHADKYTGEEKTKFEKYVADKIAKLKGEPSELRRIFLSMYAQPVLDKKIK